MSDLKIRLTPSIAAALWEEAKKLEVGLRFEIDPNQIEPVRALLYAARKDSNDPELQNFSVITGPDTKEVWLVRKSAEVP